MTVLDTGVTAALFCAVAGFAYWFGRYRPGDVHGDAATAPAGAGAAAMPAPRPRPAPAIARVEYEEDEDLDPTKVGVTKAPRTVYQPPVQQIVYDEDAAEDAPTLAEALFLVHASAQTDKGLRRKQNEDSLLVAEHKSLFVVADGMGGYSGGAVASQLAVKTIASAFETSSFEGAPHENLPRRASELARAIQMANAKILDHADGKRELEGMGTTICAARFSANKARLYLGHVGDSRCYRLRDGEMKAITADHTMADHGVTGPQAAELSRAVGIWPTVPIDVVLATPKPGDVYMLCSDGLTKMVPDPMIADILRAEEDLDRAVAALILRANERGGKDNITVILIRVLPAAAKERIAQAGKRSIGSPT